jgi:hypothetical protein
MKWQQNSDADGYVIYWGKSPEKYTEALWCTEKTNISSPEPTERMLIISRSKL